MQSRAWQLALCVIAEGLQREEAGKGEKGGGGVVPTERERVLAKRVARDAVELRGLRTEVGRLRAEVRSLREGGGGGW